MASPVVNVERFETVVTTTKKYCLQSPEINRRKNYHIGGVGAAFLMKQDL